MSGEKFALTSTPSDHDEVVKSRLEALKDELREPKFSCKDSATFGLYDYSDKRVKIVHEKGKLVQFMGYFEAGQKYLRNEEVLYLLQKNAIHLEFPGGIPLRSMEEAFCLFLDDADRYRVYCKLTDLGYKVIRHRVGLEGHDLGDGKGVKRRKLKSCEKLTNEKSKNLSYDEILDKILIPNGNDKEKTAAETETEVIFDVFSPTKKKEKNPKPDFAVRIAEKSSDIPSKAKNDLETGDFPVVTAVISHSDVDFFTLTQLELKLDL